MQQIREDPRVAFEALPPVEQVALAGPDSHRFVRQDDALWGYLHEGVLTTSLVRGALGLYEQSAARKMSIPKGRVGHSELMKAYHHLRHQPPAHTHDAAEVAAAAAHNAAAVVAYNQAKRAAREQDVQQDQGCNTAPLPPPAAAARGAASQAANTVALSKSAKRRQKKQAAKVAEAAQPQGPAAAATQSSAWQVSEEQKLRKARALSSLGLLSICCSWGKAQEAAALLQVAGAFPLSQLAEVGLCRLQEHMLPAEWGFVQGSLPPIGASPDALIRHPLSDACKAAAGATPASQPAGNGGAAGHQQAAGPKPATVGPWDVDALLERLQLADSGTAAAGLQDNSSETGAGSLAGASAAGGWLIEVVEVKNTCPFGHSRRGGRLRTSEFAVADRGPRSAVPLEWVPQLQLHMLCTGTASGLLVSRSATKGTHIFRMRRDDVLLRLMLTVISRLWQQHVLPGQPPPADVYASWREHHEMMRRIGEVARGTQVIVTTDEGHYLPGSDARWFLD